MKIAVISGSIREQNTTEVVALAVLDSARAAGHQADVITLDAFGELFRGRYITLASATAGQRPVLQRLAGADWLLFVVPTYYKSMPGALKNFFDAVRYPEIYQNKLVGIIASNHKNQDYGARHAEEVIKGMLIFSGIEAIVMPEILIQYHQAINGAEIDRFLHSMAVYPRMHS